MAMPVCTGDLPLFIAVPVEEGLTGFRCRLQDGALAFTLILWGDLLRFISILVKTERVAPPPGVGWIMSVQRLHRPRPLFTAAAVW